MLTMHFNTKTSNNEVDSQMLCFVNLAKRATIIVLKTCRPYIQVRT